MSFLLNSVFVSNISVLMCLCVDQASYLADSEMWRPQLLYNLGQCTEGPTLHRTGPAIRPCALPPPVSHYYNTKRRPFPLRSPLPGGGTLHPAATQADQPEDKRRTSDRGQIEGKQRTCSWTWDRDQIEGKQRTCGQRQAEGGQSIYKQGEKPGQGRTEEKTSVVKKC